MYRNTTRLSRRALLAGFAATAGGAILAGCGDTATTPAPVAQTSAGAAPTTAPVATTAPTAATVATSVPTRAATAATMSNLTIKYGILAQFMGTTQSLVQRFRQTNPNITVEITTYPGYREILQAVQAGLAARTPPTVTMVGYGFMNYAAKSFPHATVDDVAKRDALGGTFLRDFAPTTLELGKVDGVQHGMPFAISVPILYTNMDLLKQAGLDRAPHTWPDVREYARRVTERTGTPGFSLIELSPFFASQGLIESNGGRLLVGSGADTRANFDSPEAIEAMQLVVDMTVKDKSAVYDLKGAQQNFTGGKIGMVVVSNASLANFQKSANFALGTAPFPTFGQKPRRVPAGGNNLMIFATDPNQQAAAWEWIKFLNSPDAHTEWIKGTGYLPVRQGLADDVRYLKPYYDENRLIQAATSQAGAIVPWVSWPGMNSLQIDKELADILERMMAGNQDTAAALREATMRVNQLIRS